MLRFFIYLFYFFRWFFSCCILGVIFFVHNKVPGISSTLQSTQKTVILKPHPKRENCSENQVVGEIKPSIKFGKADMVEEKMSIKRNDERQRQRQQRLTQRQRQTAERETDRQTQRETEREGGGDRLFI